MRPNEDRVRSREDKKYTSFSPKTKGLKAFYLLLDEINIPVARWEYRPVLLASRKGILVIVKPMQILSKDEIGLIKRWVSSGNILFYADDRKVNNWKQFGVVVKRTPTKKKQVVLRRGNKGVTDDFKAVYIKTSLRFVRSQQHTRKILSDGNGSIISETRLGRGKIYLSTDPSMFTNEMILKEDNVLLLTRLLRSIPAGGKVYFDEYHQGFQMPDRTLWDILGTPFYGVLIQFILLLVVVFYSIGYRFGRPRIRKEFVHRTADEYVYAMANLYYRAGKWSLILRILYRSFYARLTAALGVSASTPEEKLLQLCRCRWPDNKKMHETLEDIFRRVNHKSSNEELTEKSALDATKEMEKIRKELWNDAG